MTDYLSEPRAVVPAGAGPGAAAADLSWEDFEARLARSLASMATDSYLIISTRHTPDEECLYYVQFAQQGAAGLLAEAASNGYLSGIRQLTPAQDAAMLELGWQAPFHRAKGPENWSRQWPKATPFAEVAALAVRTLREIYGVARPSDLVYQRFSRGGHPFADVNLGIPSERATTPRGAGQPTPPTAEELTPKVEAALRSFLGVEEVAADTWGNYPVLLDGSTIWVRILPLEPPAVRVFASIVNGLNATPALIAFINELNAEINFGRVLLVNGDIIVTTELRGIGLTIDDIAWSCAAIHGAARGISAKLIERFPATPAPTTPPDGGTLVN